MTNIRSFAVPDLTPHDLNTNHREMRRRLRRANKHVHTILHTLG